MKKRIISKFAALAAAAVLLGSTLFVKTSRAQTCNCLILSPSNIQLCDTCYTFELTNTCDSAISSITISDPGKTLDSGCAEVEDPTHETWKATQNIDGSITYTPLPGNPCLQPGQSMLISDCNMQKGDLLNMEWTNCGGSSPFSVPCGAYPPGETAVAP